MLGIVMLVGVSEQSGGACKLQSMITFVSTNPVLAIPLPHRAPPNAKGRAANLLNRGLSSLTNLGFGFRV